jgi:hypothetical protein
MICCWRHQCCCCLLGLLCPTLIWSANEGIHNNIVKLSSSLFLLLNLIEDYQLAGGFDDTSTNHLCYFSAYRYARGQILDVEILRSLLLSVSKSLGRLAKAQDDAEFLTRNYLFTLGKHIEMG